MLIRACVRSQGKGSYKHKALISIGFYLLNEEKGAKKKALISIQALIRVGSYKHTTTVLEYSSICRSCTGLIPVWPTSPVTLQSIRRQVTWNPSKQWIPHYLVKWKWGRVIFVYQIFGDNYTCPDQITALTWQYLCCLAWGRDMCHRQQSMLIRTAAGRWFLKTRPQVKLEATFEKKD